MRNHILLTATLLAASIAPARADFLISTATPDAAPAPDRAATQPMAQHDSAAVPPNPGPRFSTAIGFGDDVPLAFAVRQIVPRAVKVTYGPGVQRTEPVSWRGGQPWNRTLAAAVKPAGLRLVMTYMAVEIER